jgi:hypothetical protein
MDSATEYGRSRKFSLSSYTLPPETHKAIDLLYYPMRKDLPKESREQNLSSSSSSSENLNLYSPFKYIPLGEDFDVSPYALLMKYFVCTSLLFKLSLAYQRFFVEQELLNDVCD